MEGRGVGGLAHGWDEVRKRSGGETVMLMGLLERVPPRGREMGQQSDGGNMSGTAFDRCKRLQHVLFNLPTS